MIFFGDFQFGTRHVGIWIRVWSRRIVSLVRGCRLTQTITCRFKPLWHRLIRGYRIKHWGNLLGCAKVAKLDRVQNIVGRERYVGLILDILLADLFFLWFSNLIFFCGRGRVFKFGRSLFLIFNSLLSLIYRFLDKCFGYLKRGCRF